MGTIDTARGPVEEQLLERRERVIDDARWFGHAVEYHFKDDGALAARFLRGDRPAIEKVNPFYERDVGGNVTIEVDGVRHDVAESALDRKVGQVDDRGEFTCWVEYRRPGSDVIVHRSVDVKLKRASAEGQSVAGNVG